MLNKEKKFLIKLGKKKKRSRGPGAKGKTNGRGTKGQKARKSGHVRPGFEGGQTPIYRRLPKRGFVSNSKKEFKLFNLDKLENDKKIVDGQKLDFSHSKKPVKILGKNKDVLTKKLNITATNFSKSAKIKIEQIGGKAETIKYAKKK